VRLQAPFVQDAALAGAGERLLDSAAGQRRQDLYREVTNEGDRVATSALQLNEFGPAGIGLFLIPVHEDHLKIPVGGEHLLNEPAVDVDDNLRWRNALAP
jgi:hypothetical protein